MLRAIVEGVEAETGERFFASLVRHLAQSLDVRYAFVSEITEAGDAFRTLALWGRGAFLSNVEVPLAGTPCASVLAGAAAHHPDRLQERFPADRGLVDWGVVSYCGVPILDAAGAVAGHLAVLDERPMPDGERALSVMRIFAARVRAERERARTEAELRATSEAFRDLYEDAPAGHLVFDGDGIVTSVNRHAAALWGHPREAMIGRSFRDLLADTPGGRGLAEGMYRRLLSGQELDVEEHEALRADGRWMWLRSSTRGLHDADGRLLSVRCTVVDVTERRRAEEALRAGEERLAGILQSAMDAIVTLDDGGRIELFNAAAERIFACPAADAIGSPFGRFASDGFARALDTALAAVAGGAEPDPWVWAPDGLRARDAAGREFAVEATIAHVEIGGRRLHTLVLRDVEERERREAELRRLDRQNRYLQEELKSVHNFEEIVGASPALRAVLDHVGLVAGTDASVLIVGETGTGKELIARAIHSHGTRHARPLIKVNCAALPTSLIESEFFGHEKGAFTGALERRVGRFELADGGTIFLDEIGELSAEVQAKLLRVLQEREFERIGGRTTLKVDVRVIAATNRDLARAVADGAFREDLYYRLNVFPVHLPPLRERREDVAVLTEFFLARYAGKIGRRITRIPEAALRRLVAYPWPGNVRELEHVIERAIILSPGPDLEIPAALLPGALAPRDLEPPAPSPPRATAPTRAPAAPSDAPTSLDDAQRRHIVAVLKRTRWRIEGPEGAADVLQLRPSTLRSRMQKLGIRRSAEEATE